MNFTTIPSKSCTAKLSSFGYGANAMWGVDEAHSLSKLYATLQMYLNNSNTGECECCYPTWASSTPNYTFLIPYLNATSMPNWWSDNVSLVTHRFLQSDRAASSLASPLLSIAQYHFNCMSLLCGPESCLACRERTNTGEQSCSLTYMQQQSKIMHFRCK